MSDDIVTRLRNMAIGSLYGINIAPFEHYNEAADEIERLRADRDKWRNLAMKEHISLCKLDDHNLCVDYLTWRHGQEMREAGWQ